MYSNLSHLALTKQMSIRCEHLSSHPNLKENYEALVRYSILHRSRHYFKINKKGRDLKALMQADEELQNIDDTSNSTSSVAQKRKRAMNASGMDKIVQAVEKLPTARCHDCKDSLPSARLHACLECTFIGCLKLHMKDHRSVHSFWMDFNNCAICTMQLIQSVPSAKNIATTNHLSAY